MNGAHARALCLSLGAALLLATALTGCGQLQTTTGTPTQPSTPLAVGGSTTPGALATGVATPSPAAPPGLTATGYAAADGSPLYKQCIGPDPAATINPSGTPGAKLPLPPVYTTPGPFAPLPSPPAVANPSAPPPSTELPSFNILALPPAASTNWRRDGTACVGGLSLAIAPGFTATAPLTITGYAAGASAQYTAATPSVKLDLAYYYTLDDLMTRFQNRSVGNGSYLLARNERVDLGGAAGLLDVSSEIVGARTRYVVLAYLVSPRPHWYLGYTAFISPPYTQSTFAEVLAMVNSTRFAP